MARKKRKTPGINGSSSADIAFMLLIFFLITTSMDTDKGLQRLLPPLPDNKQQDRPPVEINERNIMRLLVNRNDEVVILQPGGELLKLKLDQLKDEVVDFIMNPTDNPNKPAKEQRNVEGLGNINVTTSGYAISLKTEIETSYQMFINVQNELIKAYNEVWDKAAMQYYGLRYSEMKDSDPRKKVISKEIYPMHISEMPLSNLKKK